MRAKETVSFAESSHIPDLSLTIAGIRFRNPVIAASGTFGFAREYEGLLDISGLGGICTRGLTLDPMPGNTGTRLHETPSGLLHSIGLENPGIVDFIENELPHLRELGPVLIANLSGSSIEEYVRGARLLSTSGVKMIELNLSCPNVESKGMPFGLDPDTAASVTSQVRKAAVKMPLMAKLSPDAPDLAAVALACVAAGADAVSLVNSFTAMAIDTGKRKPVFDNTTAGLSGPCIRPIALRMVWELCETVKVPVVGVGGIASASDALQFLLAGAAAVQVGSATFAHPPLMNEVISGIRDYMREKGFSRMGELSIRRSI